ncbi:hypothetical protein AAG570_013696 [Ranatra chinensis]|uniref:Uncharacterized protein n=1 Tax=Ranatra chinensis TaxID=642074 RepID=A0ABD0YCX5_9HEMI
MEVAIKKSGGTTKKCWRRGATVFTTAINTLLQQFPTGKKIKNLQDYRHHLIDIFSGYCLRWGQPFLMCGRCRQHTTSSMRTLRIALDRICSSQGRDSNGPLAVVKF